MRKLSTPALQRKHWRKALGIARILFEEDGYHTTYLDEIETFICADPTLDAATASPGARLAERLGTGRGWRDSPQDPRHGTGDAPGQAGAEVLPLHAAEPSDATAPAAPCTPAARHY